MNKEVPETARLRRETDGTQAGADRLIRRDKFTNYVVFVPFFLRDGATHLLFEKRSAEIRQGGEICFPGGAVETDPGETAEEAAVRETVEELGLPPEKIRLEGRLGVLATPWGSAVDLCFGTLDIADPGECRPQPGEVEKVFSIPLDYFRTHKPEEHYLRHEIRPEYTDKDGRTVRLPWRELGLPDRYSRPWGLRLYPAWFYRRDGETIWGMTADFIREILELLDNNPD